MKTVTYQQFLKFNPCWQYDKDKDKAAKLEEIGLRKAEWTALDVLDLPDEEVSVDDKLWAVLRPEFIPEPILHEFACRCAEEALKLVENPDPRCIAAIKAKRRWLRGEISNKELSAARAAARAAASDAARAAASVAASDAAWDAWDSARAATWAAWAAVNDAASAAAWAARDAAHAHQIQLLRKVLHEQEHSAGLF